MSVFNRYAQYYDLLYKDKDYTSEAEFTHKLIQKYLPNARSILELGCGTGKHAAFLAVKGYKLHGIDRSPEMLKNAELNLTKFTPEQTHQLTFSQGDIRNVRINERFDVVISLFHVMSYQTTNSDLKGVFETVNSHLNTGGLFIFDCWYGPAIFSDLPKVRSKQIEDETIQVTRLAEPVMDFNNNLVEINYQILIKDKSTKEIEEIHETHIMRYLFKPEIEFLFDKFGFESLDCAEWMTGSPPGPKTWGVFFVGRKLRM